MTLTILEACDQVLNHLAVLLRDTKQLALHGKVPNWLKQKAIRKLYRLYRQRSKWCDQDLPEQLSGSSGEVEMKNALNAAEGSGLLDIELLKKEPDENDNTEVDRNSQEEQQVILLRGTDLQVAPKTPVALAEKEVRLFRLLGSGGFGSVYLGTVDEVQVAVKKLHANSNNNLARLESFRAELNVLHLLPHPNVVQTLAASPLDFNQDASLIIMEFAGHRNLQQLINDPGEELDPLRRIHFSVDVARALQFAHTNCVVHLDVKPANIIVGPDDTCKLGDFGCCQLLEADTGMVSPTHRSALTGTFAYRAPELLKGCPPTPKADIYSFGITMWQMMTRELPYGKENQHVVIFGVVAYNLRPTLPAIEDPTDYLDLCYRDLVVQCWDADISIRPTSADLADVFQEWKTHI